MNLLLLGPQGSGKGSQAEKLIEKFGLAYIEMGGLLRKIAKEDSSLGNKVKDFIEKGFLVPDEVTIEVLNNYLRGIGELEGMVLDGFPRVLSQAKYFERFLNEKGKKIDLVIYLTLSREDTLRRLTNRRICPQCGRIFNLLTNPPQKEGICDSCQGKLILRSDETPEAINKRLDEFEKQTKPLIDFFRQRNILEEIDGSPSIDAVFAKILQKLKNRGLIEGD